VWFGRIRPVVLHGPLQLFTVLSLVTVITAAGLRRGPLVWRPVRAIGRWSFGIYLWHVPIGMIVRAHVAEQWWEAILTAAISTAVAAASYRLIERPVRLRRPAGRVIGWSLAPIAVVAAVLGLVEVQAQSAKASAGLTAEVTVTVPTSGPSAEVPLAVTIIGDSVPAMAADELAAAGSAAGFTTTVHAADGCLQSTHAADQFWPPCVDWTNGLPAIVAPADIVVLWWANTGATAVWHGDEYEVCAAPDATRGRLDEMVALLSLPSTTTLVVVLPSERADQGLRDHQGAECQRELTVSWAAEHDVTVFDPDPARTAAGSEREVRSDGLHYTPQGARAVAAALFAALPDSDARQARP
jgi:hypothetical protein